MKKEPKKKEKEEKVPFKHVTDVMEKIVARHKEDTIAGTELREFRNYKYSPLELTFFSERLFSKKGVATFLHILKLMREKGIKKEDKTPLTQEEKDNISKEIRELLQSILKFRSNPHHESDLLRDRLAARDFFSQQQLKKQNLIKH